MTSLARSSHLSWPALCDQIQGRILARNHAEQELARAREGLLRDFERVLPVLAQAIEASGRTSSRHPLPSIQIRPHEHRGEILRLVVDQGQLHFLRSDLSPELPVDLATVLTLLGDDPLGKLLSLLRLPTLAVPAPPAPVASGVFAKTSARPAATGPHARPVARTESARPSANYVARTHQLPAMRSEAERRSEQYDRDQARRTQPFVRLRTSEGRIVRDMPEYDHMDDE